MTGADPHPSRDPRVDVYVVALAGDAAGLATTLADLERDRIAAEAGIHILGSDDPALEEQATRSGYAFTPVLPTTIEPAAWWTTLLNHRPAGNGDRFLAVVRAGCRLSNLWLRRLCHVADRTGADAVFPVSVRHRFTSAFDDPAHRPGLGVTEVDRWINRHGAGIEFDIPQPAGYCGLFRGRLPPLEAGDDRQLAADWREQGARLIATDAVYIDDSALPALPATTLYPAWDEAFAERHPLTAMRHPLTELSTRAEPPPPELTDVRPLRLHISHSWGGGLERWLANFIAADEAHRTLVLRPIGHRDAFCKTLALYPSADMNVPLQTWTLAQPILSTALGHHQYRAILTEVLETYGVASIMVSSLIGHSLEALESGLPTTYICHDFYPACPPLYATWGDPCTYCDSARLKACLVENPLHQFFRQEPASHWLTLRDAFARRVLEHDIAMVTPSRSVARRWRTFLPALEDKPMEVIEHGLSPDLIDSLAGARQPRGGQSGRLRILILGSLTEYKGASLLRPVLNDITAFADLILLGAGEDGEHFRGTAGVTVVERFEHHQLGSLLAEHAPDLGLLLSTVPETFSYTLSELRAAGIPVAVTALGAFADRTEHGRDGWLFEPDSESLLSLLRHLDQSPGELDSVRDHLQQQTVRSVADMMREYDRLEQGRITLFSPLKRPPDTDAGTAGFAASGNLHINHMAPYRQVLKDFLRYTRDKVLHSPRLPAGLRKLLARLLGRSFPCGRPPRGR